MPLVMPLRLPLWALPLLVPHLRLTISPSHLSPALVHMYIIPALPHQQPLPCSLYTLDKALIVSLVHLRYTLHPIPPPSHITPVNHYSRLPSGLGNKFYF
ncbi:hypothetical protein KC19_VG092000 [Ceratodon purpureus]|uniref:Secreted protein n=1 Tax=Ceratodon purpureus TaxID=3225 RepID=A0A8T0HP25_CERPU|nr:hypothetical protein KC19_VG092000 [Ceratodon purpureus]